MDADTAPAIVPDAVTGPANPLDMLGGLAGLDLGAMLGAVGIDLPDPDDATLNDLAESLDELHAKLDWLAGVIGGAIAKAPARYRPDPPEYPG